MALRFGLPRLSQFQRDAQLIIVTSGIFAVSFFGVQQLLKVLYVLRLGYSLEYIGLFNATGAMAYMAMSIPSGALSNRFGTRPVMIAGGILTVVGMAILPLVEFVPEAVRQPWPIIFWPPMKKSSGTKTSFPWIGPYWNGMFSGK